MLHQQSPVLTLPLVFATAFMCLFSVVIALFKVSPLLSQGKGVFAARERGPFPCPWGVLNGLHVLLLGSHCTLQGELCALRLTQGRGALAGSFEAPSPCPRTQAAGSCSDNPKGSPALGSGAQF